MRRAVLFVFLIAEGVGHIHVHAETASVRHRGPLEHDDAPVLQLPVPRPSGLPILGNFRFTELFSQAMDTLACHSFFKVRNKPGVHLLETAIPRFKTLFLVPLHQAGVDGVKDVLVQLNQGG